MLIFSRNRGPWVVTAFVVVVATGSFIKFQADAEKEAAAIEKDKQSFVAFNQSVQKELGKAHKLNCFLSSTDAVFFLIAKNLIATLRQMRCSNSSILNSRKL